VREQRLIGVVPTQKLFEKTFKKVLTTGTTYDTMTTVRERRKPKMMNWYMNPELHDEDYEDLLELLNEEEEEG
jgi:hypothetical protein